MTFKKYQLNFGDAGEEDYDVVTGPCAVFKINFTLTNSPWIDNHATYLVQAHSVASFTTHEAVGNAGGLSVAEQKAIPFFPGTIEAGVLNDNGWIVQSASCAPAGTDPVNFQTDDVTDGGNSSADAQSDFVWGPCNAFKVTYAIDDQGATGTTSARVPAADYYWFNTNGDIMSASQMPVQDYGAFPKDREAGVLHGNRMTVSSVTCA